MQYFIFTHQLVELNLKITLPTALAFILLMGDTKVIVFFPGKVCGSLTHSISEKISEKIREKKISPFFFFQRKSLNTLTHSQSEAKKKQRWKKKHSTFSHSLEICPKLVKNKHQGNKKI